MERFAFIAAQPWFEPDVACATPHNQEQDFAACEIFEGVGRFELRNGAPIAFRASVLASSSETRLRLALQGSTDGGVGSKRARDDHKIDGRATARLLVRFESAGRALQGRLIHTHIERLTDNVSKVLASDGTTEPATPFMRLALGAVDLIINPLPESQSTAAAAALARVIDRMLAALPPASKQSSGTSGEGTGVTTPSAATHAARSVCLSTLTARSEHWRAFARCAAQLSARLQQDGSASRGDAGGPGEGRRPTSLPGEAQLPSADPTVASLLAQLPIQLGCAMPPTGADGVRTIEAATAAVQDAEARYVRLATRHLCGAGPGTSAISATSDPATPPAVGAGDAKQPTGTETNADAFGQLCTARDELLLAHSTRLEASSIPRRGPAPE